MHKKHTKKRVPAWAKCVLAAVLAACLFAPNLATTNRGAFADANYNYFEFGYPSAAAMLADANSLNQEICEEGFTLLKNDGLLPMTPPSGQKIKASAFGNNSASLIYCGFGSSDNWKGETSVYDAFAPSVFELNPTLKAFYNDSGKSGAKINPHASIDNYRMGMDILETPRSAYTSDIIGSYQNYNDLAIVFLTRTAGEGSDLPTTSLQRGFAERSDAYKLSGARHWDDHYLQLDKNEVDMLQMVMDNFDKIMVVVNGSSYVELGFLDDPAHYLYTDNGYTGSTAAAEAKMAKFKAAINVNMPGSNGILALPRIMDGTVNPSGHLVDTFVRDMKNDPTYKNQGLSGLTEAELRYGEYYVHYDEDIYMGYRYYETRYIAEGGNGGDWYRENVVYPFGHGLSYTDFSWEVTGSQPDGGNLDKDGKIALTVRVTNTGTRAGKDVVQLYYNAPYYAGGIAKAHVVLGNFEKTKLLAPGDHEDVVVELKVSDMYSYDWSDANGNGFKGYELEAGAYNIIAAHDAHDAAQLPEERAVTYGIEGGFRYDTDTTTGAAVANLFDYASGAGKTNDPQTFKGVRQYMSRDDFEGTFPTHALAKQTGLRQGNRAFTMSGDADEPWYTDVMPVQAAAPGTSATNTVKLWHMKGRSYDDPLWDDLLNQLTVEEMANQIGNGFRGPREIASIDKPTVWDTDGPLGRRESQDIQWAGNPILAQSFNRDLAYRQGVLFGNAVFTGPNGRGGTYGVGLNIHRSPFAGRAFEYYSEDGLVAGSIGSEVIAGSLTKGGYQVAKHLMLNDQETERNTVQTWVSEQALREIYGKGFELGVKLGGLNALMTGVDAIGDIYCSLNYNLLEGLVRGEWGFQGFIITDMKCEDTNISMRAGIDTMMSYPAPKPPVTNAESLTPTHVASMRRAVKNIFFTMANTTGINGVGGDRLERINYIGANALYSVQGVDNKLSVASALVKNDPGAELTYALRAGSSLPDGMTLEADGTLGGAPAEAGTYTFSVAASEKTDAYYPYKDANKIFRLTVYAQNRIPDQIIYEDVDLGVIPSGFYYSKSIKGAVVFGPDGKLGGDVAYSLAEGSRLPDGLALEDGILGGNVTANSGVYFFTVEASYAGKQSALLDFIVRVKRNDIVYGSTPIADLTVGRSAVISVASAYNDDGIPIKYAVKDGSKLPDGLTLQSNGIITGTPTRAYNGYKFSVLATGENAPATEAEFSVNVLGVVFGDVAYDGLIIGKAYKFNLGASPNNGTSADIYYELKEGSALPNGFKLLADGTLYGVGDTWGAQSFTVVAKSEGNATVEASVTLDFYTVFEDPLEDEEVVPPPAAPAAKGCGSAAAAALLAGAFVICFGIKFSLTGVYK